MKATYDDILEKLNEISVQLEMIKIDKGTPEWAQGQDKISFEGFYICSNHYNWLNCKEEPSEQLFYLRTNDRTKEYGFTGFNLDEAKVLRDYLSQKIDYLEN